MSQLFAWSGQSTGVSASAPVLPMNTQDWSPLGWTHWVSFQSKGLSRVFSNTTVKRASIFQHSAFFTIQLSHPYMTTGKTIALTRRSFVDYQFSSVQSLSRVRLFATPCITAHQASLSIINSQSLLKLMPIESVMPSSHLILCHPLLFLPPIPPSIRVFSNKSTLCMSWLAKVLEFQLQHQSFQRIPRTILKCNLLLIKTNSKNVFNSWLLASQ